MSSRLFLNPDFQMDFVRGLYSCGFVRGEDSLEVHTPPLPGDL